MQIKKVTITNFRLFKNKTVIDFDEKVTSLVGKNGTGKTAILEAINLATGFYFIENKIKEDDFNDDKKNIEVIVEFDELFLIKTTDSNKEDIKFPSRKIKFVAKHTERADSGKAFSNPFRTYHHIIPEKYNSVNELNLPDKRNVASRVFEESITESDGQRKTILNYEDNDGARVDITEILYKQTDDLEGFPNVFYFSKNREKDLKQGFSTTFQKIVNELNWRFLNKHKKEESNDYISKWEKFYNYILSKVEEPKQKKIVQPLHDKVRDILGDKFDKFEISLINLKNPFNQAFFSLRDGEKIITLANMGSGELMIVTYFLLKITSELSKEAIIFLIDEPELHLHPQLQFRLFDEIKSSDYQHIFTTHSESFIDMNNWQSIKRFSESGIFPKQNILKKEFIKNSTTQETQPLKEHLDEIKKCCHDKTVFLREHNELFFSDKSLLVEGANDKYGLLYLLEKLGCKRPNQLSVINCLGKGNIPYYQMLCLVFGVDYFVVYDFDKGGDSESKDQTIKAFGDSNKIFSFEQSFEKVIRKDKLNKILEVIENMDEDKIPDEINDCCKKINNWLKY